MTIAELLTWTAVVLAQYPHHAAGIAEEVEGVLRGRPLCAADVPRLHYVQQVLLEVLRLYPPTWMFVRVARSVDVLPSGTAIPAGAKIYLSQYVTHRDPRFFPDPERFDPARFTEEGSRTRPPFAYFPFGGGPRVCLGETLDRMEAALILATIVPRLHMELIQGQNISAVPAVTLRPFGSTRVIVRPR